ncbi:MAG: phospholipid-binding domain-containing protein, partial [Rhodospirillaceae bacterium]|nr:phospholipid-binding domain-containing protein [Rhodospirillaceae bacterium]
IYLAGIAQDQQELDKVITHARRIKYVKKVISHILLKSDPNRKPGP